MGDEQNNKDKSGKMIGGTVYRVEAAVSEGARETVYSKMKRLILSNINTKEVITDNRIK